MKNLSKKEKEHLKMFVGFTKNIPTIHKSKRNVREIRKVYESLIQPKTSVLPIEKSFTKDKTKFSINNVTYGKGRFVLNAVKDYIERNNPTLEQLRLAFPESLAAHYKTLGLIREVKDVVYKSRYFYDDVLETRDNKQIVVCSQFGIKNIMPVFKQAKRNGLEVSVVKS